MFVTVDLFIAMINFFQAQMNVVPIYLKMIRSKKVQYSVIIKVIDLTGSNVNIVVQGGYAMIVR